MQTAYVVSKLINSSFGTPIEGYENLEEVKARCEWLNKATNSHAYVYTKIDVNEYKPKAPGRPKPMSVCPGCNQEMTDPKVQHCDIDWLNHFEDGSSRRRVTYKSTSEPKEHGYLCHDCNVAPGAYHHLNCDVEICPKCGGQLISCGCYKPGFDLEQWRVDSKDYEAWQKAPNNGVRLKVIKPSYWADEASQSPEEEAPRPRIRVGDLTVRLSVDSSQAQAFLRELAQLKADGKLATDYIAVLERQREELRKKDEELSLRLEKLEDNLGRAKEGISIQEKERAMMALDIDGLKVEKIHLLQKIRSLEEENKRLVDYANGLDKQLVEARAKIDNYQNKFANLHAANADLGIAKSGAFDYAAGLEKTLDQTRKELENLRVEAGRLLDEGKISTHYVSTLEAQRDAALADVKKFKEQRQANYEYIDALKNANKGLGEALKVKPLPSLSNRQIDIAFQGLTLLRDHIQVYNSTITDPELDSLANTLNAIQEALETPAPSGLREALAPFGPDVDRIIAILQAYLLSAKDGIFGSLAMPDPLPSTPDQWLAALLAMQKVAIGYRQSLEVFAHVPKPITPEQWQELAKLANYCYSCISIVYYRKEAKYADGETLTIAGELVGMIKALGGLK